MNQGHISIDEVEAQQYLTDALGDHNIGLKPFGQTNSLPFHLADEYRFARLSLLGGEFLLVSLRQPIRSATQPLQIRKALEAVKKHTGFTGVYLSHPIAAYERKRLIEHKVPFIVPGNQMYLPHLLLDLRENFIAPKVERPARLTPTTQAFFLVALQLGREVGVTIQAAQVGEMLQVTATSVTRAIRELAAAELIVDERIHNRSVYFNLADPAEMLWKKAQPLLQSPVKRRVWTKIGHDDIWLKGPKAGLSALSDQTMLAHIDPPSHATTVKEWKKAQMHGIQEVPPHAPESHEWELWNYRPGLGIYDKDVDVLSLYLSLRQHRDERVQIALDELMQGTSWSLD